MAQNGLVLSPVRESQESLTSNGCEEVVLNERNDTVLSGTIKGLMERLLPPLHSPTPADPDFIFAFLLNARIFVPVDAVLQHILQWSIFEQNTDSRNFHRDSAAKFGLDLFTLAELWARVFPYDFRSSEQRYRLKELCELIRSLNTSLDTRELFQNLKDKLSRLERYESALVTIASQVSYEIQPSEAFRGMVGLFTPDAVAEQLAHIELERLSMIGPEEIIYSFVSPDKFPAIPKERTKNVEHYIDWFNRLSFVVATEICRHLKRKHRTETAQFFIDVAQECFNLGNFNSLMAIFSGIHMSPVARLKRTWAKANLNKLNILAHQLDPAGNFGSYRATLKAAQWRSQSAHFTCEKIIIPFFSLFVKDMQFKHEECVKLLPNGHVNFSKFSHLAEDMADLVRWKEVVCPFKRDSNILQKLITAPTFTESQLQLASFACEPPESPAEKQLEKQLKLKLLT